MTDYPSDFPKKSKNRSFRRRKIKYLKNKAKNFFKRTSWSNRDDDEAAEFWANRHFESMNCNCWMCRNPRRVFKGKDKLTIQERKQPRNEETE